jgi:hypothetical protein
MRQILSNVSSNSNITETVGDVRLTAFALVLPYIDHVSILSSNTSDEARLSSLAKATNHCTTAFTKHLEAPLVNLTAQERRLKDAIEGVLKRICNFGTSTLRDALAVAEKLENASRDDGSEEPDDGRRLLKKWDDDVEHLMEWLGWSTWQRCPRRCNWDVCFVF